MPSSSPINRMKRIVRRGGNPIAAIKTYQQRLSEIQSKCKVMGRHIRAGLRARPYVDVMSIHCKKKSHCLIGFAPQKRMYRWMEKYGNALSPGKALGDTYSQTHD